MGSGLSAQQKQLAFAFKTLLQQHEHSFKTKEVKKFTKKVDLICPWLQKDRSGTIDLALWDSIGEALQADPRASVMDQMLWSKIRMSLARLTPNNILLSHASATKFFKMGGLTPVTTKQPESLSTTDQSQVKTTQPQLLPPPDLASVTPVPKGPLEQIDTESGSLHGQNMPLGPEQIPHLNSPPPGPGETTGEIEQKVVTDAYDWLGNTAWELKLAATFVVSIPCSEFPLSSASVSSPPPSAVSLPVNAALSKDIHATPELVSPDANGCFPLHIWVQNTQQLKAEETIANLQPMLPSQPAPTSQIMAVVPVPDSHPTLTLQMGGKPISGQIDSRAHVTVISVPRLPQLQIPSTLALKGLSFLPNFNPGKTTQPHLWKPPEDDDDGGGGEAEEIDGTWSGSILPAEDVSLHTLWLKAPPKQ